MRRKLPLRCDVTEADDQISLEEIRFNLITVSHVQGKANAGSVKYKGTVVERFIILCRIHEFGTA